MEFCACLGTTELVRVSYSAEQHSWLADGRNYPLQPSDLPKVHAFIDGSVIELILSERIGYTKRFYYSGLAAPDITIRASGAGVTLKAWKISPITTDRLTTIGPLVASLSSAAESDVTSLRSLRLPSLNPRTSDQRCRSSFLKSR